VLKYSNILLSYRSCFDCYVAKIRPKLKLTMNLVYYLFELTKHLRTEKYLLIPSHVICKHKRFSESITHGGKIQISFSL